MVPSAPAPAGSPGPPGLEAPAYDVATARPGVEQVVDRPSRAVPAGSQPAAALQVGHGRAERGGQR